MMTRPIKTSTASAVELAYVLVADADLRRAAACLESIKPFNVGVLVARDGDEAIGILERFGPPILLIIDLSLSRKDGFAVIEALRGIDRARSEIIAWSSFRELREFAAHRLSGLNVRVLGGAVAPAVVQGAIARALRSGTAAAAASGSSPGPTAEEVHRTMTELSDKARHLCGTPGVSVFLRVSGETQFRASITWTSAAPIPHSPYYMPRVFGRILETGEALVLPDLATQPLSDVPTSTLEDVVRGLVAVPIVDADQQIVGTICVFDLKPLTLGSAEVDALKALGRGLSMGLAASPVKAVEGDREEALQVSDPTPTESQADDAAEAPSSVLPTALLDRHGGHIAITRELARARREQRQLSVILFDVGAFSRINERRMAEPAPELFGTVGETLMRAIRGSDLAIRWSGAELLLVVPGLSVTEARPVAERVRAAMQAGARHRVAVAGGMAELMADETLESVVARASEKVRLARERGHNHVA